MTALAETGPEVPSTVVKDMSSSGHHPLRAAFASLSFLKPFLDILWSSAKPSRLRHYWRE